MIVRIKWIWYVVFINFITKRDEIMYAIEQTNMQMIRTEFEFIARAEYGLVD